MELEGKTITTCENCLKDLLFEEMYKETPCGGWLCKKCWYEEDPEEE